MLRKPFFAFSLSLFLSAGLAAAQVTPPAKKPPVAAPASRPAAPVSSEERVAALTASMTQALGLTPAQTEKVRDINTKSVRKVEAARQRFAGEPAAKLRGAIEDIGLARLEQLKDVLTPAQFSRYQQKREEKLGIPTVRGYQGTPPPSLGGRGGEE
ncbi:MAG TPA: hypothetical protein VFO93_04085 [Hymenobacter sp.]|uniref:hypothetical protein n=1 Tax=Hymenobacter sp. TaxID=1898978 RepID=UPI002D7F441B|nr:hypothetical protein [Hymenobacter sp.]HET9502694.1 hypothetical protein [Hymenobacter sp.]